MVLSEQEITEQNKKAHSDSLDRDIENKVKKLNEIVEKNKFIKEEKDTLDKDRVIFEAQKKEHEEAMNEQRRDLAKKIFSFEHEVRESASFLEKQQREVKEATRRLDKLNYQCINAEKDFERLTDEISSLNKEIEKLTSFVVKVEETKEQLHSLEESCRESQGKIDSRQIEMSQNELTHQQTLERVIAETREVEDKRDKAESELKSYVDQLHTAMNDYYIIKLRLESHWNKTFPELEVPLAM
jgi:chromosome segregation ATPase